MVCYLSQKAGLKWISCKGIQLHRINAAAGATIPGLVVGSPNRYGGDPDFDAVKDDLAPAKAYLDVRGSYSSNEYAIDYNAPVVMLTSFFAKK